MPMRKVVAEHPISGITRASAGRASQCLAMGFPARLQRRLIFGS